MKRQLKKTMVVVAALALMLTSTLSTSAAGLKDVFDAKYYTERYEDLNKAFGYNEGMLYEHYLTYGLTEGRVSSPILNVAEYRAAYSDLDAAFGDNWDAYVEHYFTYGIKEGRTGGVYFDPIAYADAYPDIKAAFGDDYVAIVNHYLTYGIEEGRTAGVVTATPSVPVGDSNTGNAGNTGDNENSGNDDGAVSGGDAEVSGGDETPGTDEENSGEDEGVDEEYGKYSFYEWVRMDTNAGIDYLLVSHDVGESIEQVIPEVMVKGSNYAEYEVDVTWDYAGYDKDVVGIYTIFGTVEASEEIPFDIPEKISCIVSVETDTNAFYGYYHFDVNDDGLAVMEKIPDNVLNPTVSCQAGADLGFYGIFSLTDEMIRYSMYAYVGTGIGETVARVHDPNQYDIDTPGTYTVVVNYHFQYGGYDNEWLPDSVITLIVE